MSVRKKQISTIIFKIISFFIGIIFIISGLVKANDPLGLAYKTDEFFEVLNILFLKPYSLAISIFIISLEVMLGLCLIIKFKLKQTISIILGLSVFFTFLTSYAVFSGKIKTCGCFGDCIPFSAFQSFIKDLILLFLIIILIYIGYHHKVLFAQKIRQKIAGKIILITVGLVLIVQFFVYLNLPFFDCLPFKKGTDLVALIQKSKLATKTKVFYTYEKNSQKIEFESAQFPNDFDSTYIFIDRRDIKQKNHELIDLKLFNYQGQNLTQKIINYQTNQQLLFVKDWNHFDNEQQFLKLIFNIQNKDTSNIYIISPFPYPYKNIINNKETAKINFLLCDNITVKTIARSRITLYQIKKGMIKNKMGDIEIKFITRLS